MSEVDAAGVSSAMETDSVLDAENEFLVQALERLMHGRTVLIIAHRLSTIQSTDAVAVLDQHRVVEIGSHAQLLANDQGLFRKLMEKQAFLQAEQKLSNLKTTKKVHTLIYTTNIFKMLFVLYFIVSLSTPT
ncbi:ATP-binding cassette sub-family B member 10, mitochondrial-like [Myxocyprinus asiaticus]|uniref:ATP-binding cassette sub-family B member 10, mitochondrial-like n=1 Tax=Myxocyprinus asiaticus TaxID=70543 RepID=UPI002223C2AD|nr:ATP-binding cassette sub-family B member 10, mitochondrial-like [Myxocyprinus asiaticus]